MELCLATVTDNMSTRLSRICGMRAAAMLVTSLLAIAYIYAALLRQARRRTVLTSQDHDVILTMRQQRDADDEVTATYYDGVGVDVTATRHNFLSEMTRRRHHLERICTASHTGTGNVINLRDVNATSTFRDLAFAKSLLFDTERQIVYCAVPKVASSTLKMAIALMTGRVDESRPINIHDSSYMSRVGVTSLHRRLATGGNSTWRQLQQLRKFIVVRHPLQRVVSAYRDKFERLNRWNEYFHNKFGKLIVFRYRERSAIFDGAEHNVSFVEFVRFLTDRELMDRHRFNVHWAPISDLCRPCHILYDYVIKLEQFDTGVFQLWKALYGDEAPVLPAEIHRNALAVRTSNDVTARYLRQLSRQQVRRLVRLYADDFRLFNYTTNIYGIFV